MKRWVLVALLVVGVVCAGIGIALNGNPFAAPTFGWTAYSPLTAGAYPPFDVAWFAWAPKVGLVALALGAGATGAAITALVLGRRTSARADRGASD